VTGRSKAVGGGPGGWSMSRSCYGYGVAWPTVQGPLDSPPAGAANAAAASAP
jgi:hypothetical protein